MDTFSPPQQPSTSSGASMKPRVIKNQFGDGYRQTSPDGLNANPRTVTLTWASIAIAAAGYIESFLDAHVGQAFWWTMPRETGARKWDCEDYGRTWPAGGYDTFNATFVERFDQP